MNNLFSKFNTKTFVLNNYQISNNSITIIEEIDNITEILSNQTFINDIPCSMGVSVSYINSILKIDVSFSKELENILYNSLITLKIFYYTPL